MFSLEAHYIQTEKDLQLSAEASVDELTYERQRIGDVALGATWLPGEQGKQYLNAYLNHEQAEVLVADGKLVPTRTGKDSLEVNTTLSIFRCGWRMCLFLTRWSLCPVIWMVI